MERDYLSMEFNYIANPYMIPLPTYSRTSIHIEVPPGVTMVPERSFEDYEQLKTIIFPNTLKHIGNYAFKGCHRLQFVYLPEGLLTIGFGCFSECTNLLMIQIPHSVYRIEQEAFNRCKRLTSILHQATFYNYQKKCFFQCKKLKHITIPKKMDLISDSAFCGCTSLLELDFPNNIIKISDNSFKECSSLKKITFVKTCTNEYSNIPKLGRNAFFGCHSLVDIDLSSYRVHTLKESCFSNCVNLETVLLSKKTKKIMDYSFSGCSSLKFIGNGFSEPHRKWFKFGVDLKHIEGFSHSVFDNCTSLKSVIVREHQTIQTGAFNTCNLKRISLPFRLHLTTGPNGEKLCDFFYTDNVEELEIRSHLRNVTYSIVYMVMYKIIQRNPHLLEKKCMNYKFYPIEVAIGRLGVNCSGEDKPDELTITNVLYFYLRNAPWMIKNLKCFQNNNV